VPSPRITKLPEARVDVSSAAELGLLSEKLLRCCSPDVMKAAEAAVDPVMKAVDQLSGAWSSSYLGYHASVYYDELKVPPAGAHFSIEWGLHDRYSSDTTGEWREYTEENIDKAIESLSKKADPAKHRALTDAAIAAVKEVQPEVISILEVEASMGSDAYVVGALDEAKSIKVYSASEVGRALFPSGQVMSRDSLAITQGFRLPPHFKRWVEIRARNSALEACRSLREVCNRSASHLRRKEVRRKAETAVGTSVFIGHGRSPLWRELKDFVSERLGMPYDEFNRVPVAGVTNIARLSEMLKSAAVALVVMTAEDERTDGAMLARMNVIHEVGLFQGRLGFTRAIVVLEEGCAEFSNINGLGQVRFPAGNIRACFEEIRAVLERENLISGST